jgi:AcrR family transcriptional regulator
MAFMTDGFDSQSPRLTEPKRLSGEALWASRQEEILTQAALLFAQHGYAETDTRLLADTLGVGKGTLYRYFPSKRELFLAAADRVMRMLRERIDADIAGIGDCVDRLKAGVRAFLAFFAEHPEFVELLMQERANFKNRTTPTFMQHRAMNVQRWRGVYQQLMDCGRVRQMPIERITDVLGNLLYGTIFTNYFNGFNDEVKSVDVQAQDIVDVVFHGLLTLQETQRLSATEGCSANAKF